MRSLGLSIYQLGVVQRPTTNFQLLSIFNQRIRHHYRNNNNNMPIAAISTIYTPSAIENGNNGVEQTISTRTQQQQRINENATAVINNEMDLYKKPDYYSICDGIVALISVPTLILLVYLFDAFSQENTSNLSIDNPSAINYMIVVIGAAFISVGILTCIYVTHRMNTTSWHSNQMLSIRRNSWSTFYTENSQINRSSVVQQLPPPPSYASVIDSELPPPPYESIIVITNDKEIDKNEKKCVISSVVVGGSGIDGNSSDGDRDVRQSGSVIIHI